MLSCKIRKYGNNVINYKTKVIAVFNQKGGVGKTTFTGIISEYAAIIDKLNVLVVDLDMQCNTSHYWVGMEPAPHAVGGQLPPRHPEYDGDPDIEERSTIADIFFGKTVLPHETFISTENGYPANVDVLVGHPALLERINTEFDNASGQIGSQIINRLAEFLHTDSVSDAYDLIVLDTAPGRTPTFRAALRAATHCVIPFEPEEKSIQGINAMLQSLESENYSRSDEDQIINIGLCANKVKSNTKLHRDTLKILHRDLPEVLFPKDIFIPYSIAFPERDIKGINPKTIFKISNKHKAKISSEAVGKYIMAHI